MGWPYEFPKLTHEEKLVRRQSLDFYACIAHYSALGIVLVFIIYRLLKQAVTRIGLFNRSGADNQGQYAAVPASPIVKATRLASTGSISSQWNKFLWWLGDDVFFAGANWGQRDEWVLGAAWASWLLVLSFMGTGKDYFHLTKRFGIIAVSQLPIQYLLALKALNPIAWAFRSSHEHINRYHRVLGRIIYGFVWLHIIFYNVYFLIAGIWFKRFFAPIIFCGVLASFGFHGIATTAMRAAREYSYRLFFVTHLVVALVVPGLLFFHAHSARLYVVEAFAVFILDLGVRRVTTIVAPSTLEVIPGTTLVKVTSEVPISKWPPFRDTPGSHIYLSLPPPGRTDAVPSSKSGIFDFLYNPFTVASTNNDDGTITFIARTRTGPMTNVLSGFASALPPPQPPLSSSTSSSPPASAKVPLGIEGPYGTMSSHFPDLLSFGATRILLVAGGVGATFTLPIYNAIQSELPTAKVQLVWAIRIAGDATWAVSTNSSGKSVLDDDNIHLYLTGDMGVADDRDNAAGSGGAVEMSRMRPGANGRMTTSHNRKRPNIEKIVDDTFRYGSEESVAVIVCGPVEMTKEVRRRVRPWAMKGRNVWWHCETFGW